MTPEEEQREKEIQGVANMLREYPFEIVCRIRKKPKGVKIIYEVTREQMEEAVRL